MHSYFSVIIPLYNKEIYIAETVQSVLNQSFENFELIIVDDGSTDKSLEIVRSYKDDRIKIYSQENKGAGAARNYGAELAKADYIAFLDADDLWNTNHLKTLKESIELFPDAGLYCNNYNINYNGKYIASAKIRVKTQKPTIIKDYFKASEYDSLAWTSAVAIPKSIYFALGGLNSDLKTGEDLDLWIRLALNYKVVFNPKPTMIYNKYIEDSLSKKNLVESRLLFFTLQKKLESKHKSLKRYLDQKRYIMALRAKLKGDTKTFKQLSEAIELDNLNFMQNIVLHTPKIGLHVLYSLKQLGKKLNRNFKQF